MPAAAQSTTQAMSRTSSTWRTAARAPGVITAVIGLAEDTRGGGAGIGGSGNAATATRGRKFARW
jgi:hypothetical protein